MRRLLPALLLLVSIGFSQGQAQEVHSGLCLFECPFGAPASNDLIIREIYILSSNDRTKFADWVAYKVTASTIGPSPPRTWKADPLLDPSGTLEPEDYDGANAALGTDRGHQAPLASFAGTTHWRDTNLLSNITPQKSDLNQGSWKRLEEKVRQLATTRGDTGVFVMTGPLYERNMPPLPQADEAHMVPSGYWKIVAVIDGGAVSLAAFIFEQDTPRNSDFCTHGTTVREVERRSGLDFFHALPKSQQDSIETGVGALGTALGC
jgi:endonuclease G, mitochondrial